VSADEFYCPECMRYKSIELRSDKKASTSYKCKSCDQRAKDIDSQKRRAQAIKGQKTGKSIKSTLDFVKIKESENRYD
jgi:hypothetical protein